MSYIKDDAKITKIAMPGAHNAGSYGMGRQACCQDDNLYTQFLYGVRQFCIRLNTRKDGTIVLAHGLNNGVPFEDVLVDLKRALEYNDTEFLVLDIRHYYDQVVGPITLRYKADPKKVDDLLAKYINPAEYALCDFDNINSYISKYKELTKKYKNHNVVIVSVNPINDSLASSKGYMARNTQVTYFNSQLKKEKGIKYCDTYSKLINSSWKTTDGIHYEQNT